MTKSIGYSIARKALCGAALASTGLYLWTITPGYERATIIEPPVEIDTNVYGHADFHAIHRLGIVVGTVHRYGCLLEGVFPPENKVAVMPELALALRTQGVEITEVQAGSLALHEPDIVPGSDQTVTGRPCTRSPTPGQSEIDYADDWFKISYPPSAGLARRMSALPIDAVLVFNLRSAKSVPHSDGVFLFGVDAPARASVEVEAQLITKDGAVPWSAEATAVGMLRHPGIVFDSGGRVPDIEPVRKAAITRLVALIK